MSLPSLRLKANADRRLRAGHLWVYSNEVDVAATPLQGLKAGQQAILEAANGKPLGVVAMSPNNLICARLLSRDAKLPLDKSLVHRLNVALSLRERLFDKPCYRLVYGDLTCCRAWWSTVSSTSSWCNWPRPPWKRTRTK
jgi:23S rRNA (cytosine1962-C5)-methyltransferase